LQLIIGNYGLSLDQARAQMGMWCMLAAPLIMSADLRAIRPEFREILLNREAIKIDQDPLGVQVYTLLDPLHVQKQYISFEYHTKSLNTHSLYSASRSLFSCYFSLGGEKRDKTNVEYIEQAQPV
jgi:hypothetical protein